MDAGAPQPRFVAFQEPRRVARPPTGPGWLHEPAIVGRRVQVLVADGAVAWRDSGGQDFTPFVPDLSLALGALTPCLIEGYVAAPDARDRMDEARLQAALDRYGVDEHELTFFASDLLFWAGQDLRPLALSERRAWLNGLLDPAGVPLSPRLRYLRTLDVDRAGLWVAAAFNGGARGIVSKRLDSPYGPGWLNGWTYTPRPRPTGRPSAEPALSTLAPRLERVVLCGA